VGRLRCRRLSETGDPEVAATDLSLRRTQVGGCCHGGDGLADSPSAKLEQGRRWYGRLLWRLRCCGGGAGRRRRRGIVELRSVGADVSVAVEARDGGPACRSCATRGRKGEPGTSRGTGRANRLPKGADSRGTKRRCTVSRRVTVARRVRQPAASARLLVRYPYGVVVHRGSSRGPIRGTAPSVGRPVPAPCASPRGSRTEAGVPRAGPEGRGKRGRRRRGHRRRYRRTRRRVEDAMPEKAPASRSGLRRSWSVCSGPVIHPDSPGMGRHCGC